jgi:indole-3-glycerol phosphate synthase
MNVLDQIVAEKKLEVARLRLQAGKLKQAAAARKEFRDFGRALRPDTGVALIAEIKKASPSAGVIQKDFDAIRIGRDYEVGGASALSVLTDQKFFQGRVEYLTQLRDAVKLPLLRKDFVIDELQIYESAAYGADAILLIAAILDDGQLKGYRELAAQLRLASLMEVHDEVELDRAVSSGAGIIGVNNRDLRDFSVDLATTEKLAAKLRHHEGAKNTKEGRQKGEGRGQKAERRGDGADLNHRDTENTEREGRREEGGGERRVKRINVQRSTLNAQRSTSKAESGAERGMRAEHTIVAESGIHSRADVERLARAGVNAILVGESLMRSGDIRSKMRELMGG